MSMTPATTPAEGWTDNHEANAALLMLDRLDVSAEDDARVEAIAATIRRLAALATPSPGKAPEPEAWRIDIPDEPELGHWLAEDPMPDGDGYRCIPLYASPGKAEAERDAARYRFLFDPSVETWCCNPLWPLVEYFRDGNDTVTKADVDAAIDAATDRAAIQQERDK